MGEKDYNITDKNPAEFQIVEDKKFFEIVLENVQEGIVILNPDMAIKYANKVIKEWYKVNTPLDGKKCFEAFHNKTVPCDPCPSKRCIESGQGEQNEIPGLPGSHAEVIELTSYPIKDDDGTIRGVIEFARNITKRKQSEEARNKSEEKFCSILNSIQEVVWSFSLKDENLVYMSPSVEQLFGRKVEEFKQNRKLWVECIHPDDVKIIEDYYNDLSEKGYSEKYHRIIKPDGSICWVRHRIKTVYDDNGMPDRMDGLFTDITEQKKREDELKESEERFRTLASSSTDAVIIADEEGKIVFCNSAAEDISGYTRDELIGKSALILRPCQLREAQAKKLKEYVKDEKAESRFIESSLLRKSGEEFPVEVSTISWKQGGRLFFGGYIRDITKRRKLEEERFEMERQLLNSQKMEALGELAGGIAHDFNNILSAIIGYAQICLRMPEEKASLLKKDLNEILQAGYRAQEMVQQILTFSRKAEGTTDKKVFQLALIIKEVLKLMKGAIPSTIEIQSNIKSSAYIVADPTTIYQIILNLCTNAVYAMRDGVGGILKIELVVEFIDNESLQIAKGNYIRLSVSDTGCGIREEIRQRIFEPFFTTKEKGESTGLGLSIVYGIIKDCKGAITVESELGKGSVFNIYFPSAEKPHEPDKIIEKDIPTGKGELILLVDDEVFMLNMGKRVLESLGYRVEVCGNPVEALELFKERADEFSLLLTDLTMPNMTGDMLVKEMRMVRPDIPVIMISGYRAESLKKRANFVGVNYVILKPFRNEDIASMVRMAIEEKRDGRVDG